uniref:(northern house mosquito) hypothetical protein n=1 Tax=Culex pipiens TaxID=7175 RepID=A0A8D8N395_CULPI
MSRTPLTCFYSWTCFRTSSRSSRPDSKGSPLRCSKFAPTYSPSTLAAVNCSRSTGRGRTFRKHSTHPIRRWSPPTKIVPTRCSFWRGCSRVTRKPSVSLESRDS